MGRYDELVEKIEHLIDGSAFSFKLTEYENMVDVLFEGYSPAGEDVIIENTLDKEIGFADILKTVGSEYVNYDADDHAAMWIEYRGTRGVPNSIRVLINDAEAIGSMIEDLYDRLMKGE